MIKEARLKWNESSDVARKKIHSLHRFLSGKIENFGIFLDESRSEIVFRSDNENSDRLELMLKGKIEGNSLVWKTLDATSPVIELDLVLSDQRKGASLLFEDGVVSFALSKKALFPQRIKRVSNLPILSKQAYSHYNRIEYSEPFKRIDVVFYRTVIIFEEPVDLEVMKEILIKGVGKRKSYGFGGISV